MQTAGTTMNGNGWKALSPANMAAENNEDVSSADMY